MKGEKICATCRSNYDFCPKCNRDKDKPLWYFTFCSQNCHDIYEITSSFENGKIDADEIKKGVDIIDKGITDIKDACENHERSNEENATKK